MIEALSNPWERDSLLLVIFATVIGTVVAEYVVRVLDATGRFVSRYRSFAWFFFTRAIISVGLGVAFYYAAPWLKEKQPDVPWGSGDELAWAIGVPSALYAAAILYTVAIFCLYRMFLRDARRSGVEMGKDATFEGFYDWWHSPPSEEEIRHYGARGMNAAD